MIILVNRARLSNALNAVERVVAKDISNDGQAVRMVYKDNSIQIIGSSGAVDLCLTIGAEVKDPQEEVIAAPAAGFAQIMRNLEGDQVELRVESNQIVIVSKGSKYKILRTQISDHFPLVFPSVSKAKVSGADFIDALNKVKYAVQKENFSNGSLRNIDVSHNEGRLCLTATDGLRLATQTVEFTGETQKFLLSRINTEYLIKILGESEITWDLSSEGTILHLAQGDVDEHQKTGHTLININIRLPVYGYVNYKSVFPEKTDYDITLEAPTLKNVLRRVGLFVNVSNHRAVTLTIKEDTLEVFANNDLGVAKEEVEAIKGGSAEHVKFSVNFNYLTDALAALDDEVRIGFTQGEGRDGGTITLRHEASDLLGLTKALKF